MPRLRTPDVDDNRASKVTKKAGNAAKQVRLPDAVKDLKLPEAVRDLNLADAARNVRLPDAARNVRLPDAARNVRLPDAVQEFAETRLGRKPRRRSRLKKWGLITIGLAGLAG